jgi:hypothetical protein
MSRATDSKSHRKNTYRKRPEKHFQRRKLFCETENHSNKSTERKNTHTSEREREREEEEGSDKAGGTIPQQNGFALVDPERNGHLECLPQ